MAARKKATSRTLTKAGVPAGFRKIETHLVGFWKPEIAGQFIRGLVGEAVEVPGADGKLNTFYTLTLGAGDSGGPIVGKDGKKITVEGGQMIGVGGKMLLIFLRGREGREVHIVFDGLGKAKAGQSAPKMFLTFERDSDD